MSTPLSIVPYDDRLARRQQVTEPMNERIVTFSRGCHTVIINGKIIPVYYSVLNQTLRMPGNAGGPGRVSWHDERRYPNQGWSCLGCPFFGFDVEYPTSRYCTHPLYLDLFGCAQSMGGLSKIGHAAADPDCPMLGKRSEKAQRLYRWHIKSHYIFWEYYSQESGRSPYRDGFRPLSSWRAARP